MMRRYLQTGLAVAAAVALLAGCSASNDPADGDTTAPDAASNAPDSLIKAGELSVCIDPEYAPLEYYASGSGGEIIGADADSAKALAAHWGVELRFEVTSFDGLIPGLQTGRCDLQLGGLYMSEERLQVTDASPFMLAGPSILVSEKLDGKVKTASDLCGLRVAAQSASSNAIRIHQASDDCVSDGNDPIRVTEYPKTADTVLAVLNDKSDALIETNVGASYMATQNDGKLVVVDTIFEPDTTFGAFTKKGNPLKEPVAEALKALYDDGTLAAILEEYELNPAILDVY